MLGPNGAETTTLRCIATLIRPIPEKSKLGIDASDELAIKKSIAFLTNEIRLEDQMTPNYAFDYYARFHEMPQELIHARRKELFDYFGINDFSEVKIGDLSTGMKQKVSIAVSLAHDPDVIIFDEPTTGLDILTAKSVTDYLKELSRQGKTVIISTYIMGLVEIVRPRRYHHNGKWLAYCQNVRALSLTNDLEDVFRNLPKGGLTE